MTRMATEPMPMKRVWDPLVRVLHWSLVVGVALAWLTSEAGRALHEAIGYAAAALVTLRIVWGLVGSRHARFRSFVRAPRAVLNYASRLLRGDAPRYVGHNPLGAWMIVALLGTLAGLSVSGWLMSTDAYFGSEALEELHEALAHALLGLVALHVTGALVTGWLHGENLVRAMVSGRKRAAGPQDVD